MKERIISGVIFLLCLILIVFANNSLVDSLIITAISMAAIYEYNSAFKKAGYKPVVLMGYLASLGIFIIDIPAVDKINGMVILSMIAPLLVISILIYGLLTNLKTSIIDLAITFFSIAYIPLMLTFLKLILMMENGRTLIWFVFMGAFASDTMAYFIGKNFGKKKLCPAISPNKTVEGSMGGVAGVIISYVIVLYISSQYISLDLNITYVMLMGIIAGIIGQFGDLSASSIKRFCKIKDFGNAIPGHGGILDRIDSLIFVAPVVYIMLKIFYMF